MPHLQALIFDLDGTLIDSAPDLRRAVNLTLRGFDRRELTLDEVKSMIGDGMLTMLRRAFAATGEPIPDQDSYAQGQICMKHYRSLKPDPAQIYPHVKETLAMYQGNGVKLGLCTNKQEAATLQLLAQLDLEQFFTFVAGGDSFPVHKPHPGHVLGVLDRLQVLAPNAVMVGDSRNDVLSARDAGVAAVVVTQGYGADIDTLNPDTTISGFDELAGALKKLGFL